MQLSTLVADLGGRGWHPGMLLVGIVVPLAIIGLVTYGIWELASSRRVAPMGPSVDGAPSGPAPSSAALAVLDERFARGEIDAEDFVQRRSLLTSPIAPVVATPTAPPAPLPGDPDVTSEQPATPAE
jgi:putative membrane protein